MSGIIDLDSLTRIELANGSIWDGTVVTTSSGGAISTGNSTTTPLLANGVFTGSWEQVSPTYASVTVSMISDKASATEGVEYQFSSDGINIDINHTGTFDHVDEGHTIKNPPHCRYFRLKYTNGNQAQTYFRVQTIYNTMDTAATTIGLNDNIENHPHVDLVRSVITGLSSQGGGTYHNVKVTPSGSITTAPGSPTSPATGSGSLTALNTDVIFDNSAGYSAISFVITGTWVATISPAVSVDNSNYTAWEAMDRATVYTSMTANGTFTANIANHRYFRLRMTAYTSGTASVSYFATANPSVNQRVLVNTQTSSTAGATSRQQVVGIDTAHDKIHLGLLFNWSHTVNLNNGVSRRISMTTGAQTEHTEFVLFADYQMQLTIYEGSTTTDGAAITEYNHSRSSANTSLCTVAQVTTFTTAGTTFFGPVIFGSTGGSAANLVVPRNNEWILKASTKYVFELTSLQNNNDITLVVDHYRNQA